MGTRLERATRKLERQHPSSPSGHWRHECGRSVCWRHLRFGSHSSGHREELGAGASGQIGDGTSTGRFTPDTIPGLSGVSSIACGAAHAIAGLTDGTMRAWGNNLGGQLGVGSNVSAFTPVTVADANNVAVGGIQRVFEGAYNSFALTTAGQVFSWGWNANGQIGDGTTTQRQNPVLLTALTGVSALSSSGYNTLAVSAGQLWAWGENAQGQLGDGTISPSSIPKSINGVTGVTSVGSAARTSFLINSRGEIWSWGQTGSPQGNGASAAQLAATGVVPTVWPLGLLALLCGSLALVAQARRRRG